MNKQARLLLIGISLVLCVAAGLALFSAGRKVIRIPAERPVEWHTERIRDSDKLLLPAELIDLLPVTFRLYQFPTMHSYELLAEYKGKTYDKLPEDLNLLLADTGVEVTEENRWTVARTFIWASHHRLGRDSPLHFEKQYVIDEADVQVPGYRYQLELQAWSQESGVVTRWKFGFEDGRIHVVLRTLVDVQEGEGPRAPLYVPEYAEKGLYFVWVGKYRGDSQYYVCCDEDGRLTGSFWGIGRDDEIENPLENPRTTACGRRVAEECGGRNWDFLTPSEVEDRNLIKKARQVYPDDRIDENTWFITVNSGVMKELFPPPTVKFYLVAPSSPSRSILPLPFFEGILAVQGDETYDLPEDMNILLQDAGLSVTEEHPEDVAWAFVWTAHRELVRDLVFVTEPRNIDEIDPEMSNYHYQLVMESWARERGVWVKWQFGFVDGQIKVVRRSVLGRFTGAWSSHWHPSVIDPFYEDGVKYYICCDEEGALQVTTLD